MKWRIEAAAQIEVDEAAAWYEAAREVWPRNFSMSSTQLCGE
jgi:hypothetical protein